MKWQYNGLVVTAAGPSWYTDPYSRYKGVSYGVPWPLNTLDILNSRELELVQHIQALSYTAVTRTDGLPSRPITDQRSIPPVLMPDTSIAVEYAKCCADRGISTRILLCATTSDYPYMGDVDVDHLLGNSQFLGHDYAGSTLAFSALNQDLILNTSMDHEVRDAYKEAVLRLRSHAALLNEHGLFSESLHLEQYIYERWRIVAENSNAYESLVFLEDAMELWPCKVWETDISSLH